MYTRMNRRMFDNVIRIQINWVVIILDLELINNIHIYNRVTVCN